jgi:hypothetical protein
MAVPDKRLSARLALISQGPAVTLPTNTTT